MVGEPLEGHTSPVTSVAYSHDGTHIVSGSHDNTIRIWDAGTGQMVGEPLEGHTRTVASVAYSHDGTRIVSGSHDNTIRIWDARTNQAVDGILNGYLASNTLPESNPPLPNRPTANLHTGWTLDKDGWVLECSRLLTWVPPDVRGLLHHPRTLVIISASGSLALDFSVAQLGVNWHNCYCCEPDLPVQ
ncbi:WD40 repeat-like protein [Ceratobasidium sp. AG-I]|nr:WD40 repeat-like protein [Ceratobasidium sp. AG-I]